jgi:hypothetical protein
MSDPATPATEVKSVAPVSPTGTPAFGTAWAPVAAIVVGVAAIILGLPAMGVALPPIVLTICGGIVSFGAVLGIVSPGARKPDGKS